MRDDELLDIGEAARLLKVSETSLRRWTNDGRLVCLRVGGRRERRFRRADLLAFAGERAGAPAARAPKSANGSAGHLLGVHGSDAGRTDLAAAFLADAFREGRAAYLLADPDAHRAISGRLRKRYPVAKPRVEGGELSALGFVGSISGQLDELEARFERSRSEGAESFCVVGDAWGVKRAVKMDGLIDYEARYESRIARRYPVTTLCLYDVRGFSAGDLMGALKLHPDTFRHPTDRLFA